jgi:hypothetical protein
MASSGMAHSPRRPATAPAARTTETANVGPRKAVAGGLVSAFDEILIDQIPLALWRSLLALEPTFASSLPPKWDYDQLGSLLGTAANLPETLHDFLDVLSELASEAGRDALMEAGEDRRVSTDGWGEQGAAELVATLFLRSRGETAVAQALDRARLAVEERGPQRVVQLFPPADRRAIDVDAVRLVQDALGDRVRASCQKKGWGSYVRVIVLAGDDRIRVRVVRGHAVRSLVAVDGDGRKTLSIRPAQIDILQLDAHSGALRVATGARSTIPVYRDALGELLFSNRSFYGERPTWTLDPLRRGEGTLQAICRPPIAQVAVIGCTYRLGNDEFRIRGPRCLMTLETRGMLAEADLRAVTFSFLIIDGRPIRVKATVTLPDRSVVSPRRYERVVHGALEQLGVLDPETKGARTLWDLSRSPHPRPVWAAHVGTGFQPAVDAGLFETVELSNVVHPDHPGAGATLTAVELPGEDGGAYGVSNDAAVPSRTLSMTDREGLRFLPDRLASRLAADMELTGAPRDTEVPGLSLIGTRDLGGMKIAVFLASERPSPSLYVDALFLRHAPGSHHVVVVPPGESVSHVPFVMLPSLAPPYDEVLPQALHSLQLQDLVEGNLLFPRASLVVDAKFQKAWLDGIPLPLQGQAFTFAHTLARAGGAVVSDDQLRRELSATRDSQVVRESKAATKKVIHAAFQAAGRAPPSFETVFARAGGGHRVGVRCAAR